MLESIPVRYILNYVESFEEENTYRSIYSDLLALSANILPELFDIQSFLMQEGQDSEADNLWTIATLNRDWKKEFNVTELQYIMNQWNTNSAKVVEGALKNGSI